MEIITKTYFESRVIYIHAIEGMSPIRKNVFQQICVKNRFVWISLKSSSENRKTKSPRDPRASTWSAGHRPRLVPIWFVCGPSLRAKLIWSRPRTCDAARQRRTECAKHFLSSTPRMNHKHVYAPILSQKPWDSKSIIRMSTQVFFIKSTPRLKVDHKKICNAVGSNRKPSIF